MGGSGELAVLGQATTARKRGGAFFPQAPSSDSQTERGPCAVALVYGCRVGAELDGGSEIGVPPGRNSSRAESPDILDLLTRLSAFPLGI